MQLREGLLPDAPRVLGAARCLTGPPKCHPSPPPGGTPNCTQLRYLPHTTVNEINTPPALCMSPPESCAAQRPRSLQDKLCHTVTPVTQHVQSSHGALISSPQRACETDGLRQMRAGAQRGEGTCPRSDSERTRLSASGSESVPCHSPGLRDAALFPMGTVPPTSQGG